jgi:hypothetical protein
VTDPVPRPTAKILTLHGENHWLPGEPVAKIVTMLEAALAEAKSGNMRACAIAWTIDDGSALPIQGDDFVISSGQWAALWTSYGRLGRRIARQMDGD